MVRPPRANGLTGTSNSVNNGLSGLEMSSTLFWKSIPDGYLRSGHSPQSSKPRFV